MTDVSLIVTDPPYNVLGALERDAATQDKPVSDVASSILCKRFRVKYERSRKPYVQTWSTSRLLIMGAPERLRERINARARKDGHTSRGIILATLQEHYGLPVDSPRRRPRPSRQRTEAT
jgi:hypothetical protein